MKIAQEKDFTNIKDLIVLKILHITYDLRDRKGRDKTSAVKNLIQVSQNFSNAFIIDLVRVPNLKEQKLELVNNNHIEINSFGLPYGLFFTNAQNRATKKILYAESKEMIKISDYNLIHAHKLTFDGYVAYNLAVNFNIPLITTLRQTDIMVFNKKPGLIKHFKPIIEKCEKIIYLIPQITNRLKYLIGEEHYEKEVKNKLVFLPNIVERKINDVTRKFEEGTFVTVLRMNKESVVRKNIKRLLMAFRSLQDKNIKLKIIGEGDYKYKIEQWVRKFGLKEKIFFLGKVDNDKIDEYYAQAEAFLLPSISESFGMVYAEALMNGTPIMYSQNRLGFDGVFEGIGVGVDPLSVDSIAEGIKNLIQNNKKYRNQISKLKEEDAFDIFSSNHVQKKYQEIIAELTV